jgi:hypothetical protein
MDDSSGRPWSNNPSAPQIPYNVYYAEKVNFAGILIGATFYGMGPDRPPVFSLLIRSVVLGIVISLFFRCMGALLNPIDSTRREIKWGLVAYTSAMFSFVTIFTAINLHLQSISYIDNREFSGGKLLPPGPLGYQLSIYSEAINVAPYIMLFLNQWLADGLLVRYSPDVTARVSNICRSPSSTVVM